MRRGMQALIQRLGLLPLSSAFFMVWQCEPQFFHRSAPIMVRLRNPRSAMPCCERGNPPGEGLHPQYRFRFEERLEPIFTVLTPDTRLLDPAKRRGRFVRKRIDEHAARFHARRHHAGARHIG